MWPIDIQDIDYHCFLSISLSMYEKSQINNNNNNNLFHDTHRKKIRILYIHIDIYINNTLISI